MFHTLLSLCDDGVATINDESVEPLLADKQIFEFNAQLTLEMYVHHTVSGGSSNRQDESPS